MGSNPTLKLNFWLPIMGILVSSALTAGVAYGLIGSTVSRNTADIAAYEKQRVILVDIQIAQGIAVADRAHMATKLDLIFGLLERYIIPTYSRSGKDLRDSPESRNLRDLRALGSLSESGELSESSALGG